MPGTACYAYISDVMKITIGDWNSKKWLKVNNKYLYIKSLQIL